MWASLLALGGCVIHVPPPVEPVPSGPPVTRNEAERLGAAGISEPVIVELVERRGAAPLTADDLVALKKAGVPDSAVQKMIALERKEPDPRDIEELYYYPPPRYYEPYPYDFYLYPSFSFGYSHFHRPYRRGVRVYR